MKMADVAKLKRCRASCRTWLQRESSKLQALLEAKEPDLTALALGVSELEGRLIKWETAQEAFELELEEDQLDAEVAAAGEFRDKCLVVKARAAKMLSCSNSAAAACAPEGGSAHSEATGTMKLPKIDLPRFSGNVLEWTKFWESFQACVGASDIPEISKLTYLISLLRGEAEQCVAGLTLSAANFSVACKLLQDRFGRKEVIIFGHIQALLSIKVTDEMKLQTLQDELLKHIRSLETLGVTGDAYGVVLTPMILSKVPSQVRLEWARDGAGREGDLQFLLDFLKKEIGRQERSSVFSSLPIQSGPGGSERQRKPEQQHPRSTRQAPVGRTPAVPAAAALQTSSVDSCGFCHKLHPSAKCFAFLRLPVHKRSDKVKHSGLCFACLRGDHRARDCSARCDFCGGRHHALCCFKQQGLQPQSERQVPSVSVPQAEMSSRGRGEATAVVGVPDVSLSCNSADHPVESNHVVLPTAYVNVHGAKGVVSARLVFDSGSQRTFVSRSLVRKIGAEYLGTKRVSYAAFGGSRSDDDRAVYMLKVSSANQSRPTTHSFPAIQVPVICPPLSRPCISSDRLQGLAGFELADHFLEGDQLSVDILCGLDVFWTLVKPGAVRVSDGLAVLESVFGWVLSGVVDPGVVPGEADPVCSQLLTLSDLHESTIRSFWELEAIGIGPKEDCRE